MKQYTQAQGQTQTLQNKEDVRVYRLHLLEGNQREILKKIDDLEDKLDTHFTNKIFEQDKRIEKLEERNQRINKFFWIVIVETIALLGILLQNLLGLR